MAIRLAATLGCIAKNQYLFALPTILLSNRKINRLHRLKLLRLDGKVVESLTQVVTDLVTRARCLELCNLQ